VSDSAAKILAIGVLGLALGVAVLALMRRRRAAAVLNGALALVFLAFAMLSLAAYLWDPEGYVGRYGAAAIGDLRLAAWGAVLVAIAVACSFAAWRSRMVFLWLGWIDNLPTVALLLYLAFWFRVF
jgi:ABC-type proline/glycine betaine transport system permease subunit